MKKFLLLLSLLILCSCKHDRVEYVDFQEYDTKSYQTFTVTKEFDTDLSEIDTKATSSSFISVASGILSCAMCNKIHQVVGTYTSVDIDGNPVTVSGKIFYPKEGEIKNMILVSHYTIGANFESPSESFSFEGIFAALGYLVIVPDYLGFGVTVDSKHPYLQSYTTASNVIDMGVAVKPFIIERGLCPNSEGVILLGYSQGGATTLHVQRLLETDPKYMGKFIIEKNYAGSGPYNIAKTYDYCVKQDVTGIPSAIPMIIQGMSIGMDKPLDMSYFFREPLLSHYDEWINSKKYTVFQMSTLIGSNRLSEILTPNATDKTKAETARFYKELMRNSIPNTYVPSSPLYMFHSEDDQTVPFINSQLMQRQFREYNTDVEYDFDHYGSHQQGCVKFILKVAEKLK